MSNLASCHNYPESECQLKVSILLLSVDCRTLLKPPFDQRLAETPLDILLLRVQALYSKGEALRWLVSSKILTWGNRKAHNDHSISCFFRKWRSRCNPGDICCRVARWYDSYMRKMRMPILWTILVIPVKIAPGLVACFGGGSRNPGITDAISWQVGHSIY